MVLLYILLPLKIAVLLGFFTDISFSLFSGHKQRTPKQMVLVYSKTATVILSSLHSFFTYIFSAHYKFIVRYTCKAFVEITGGGGGGGGGGHGKDDWVFPNFLDHHNELLFKNQKFSTTIITL